VGSSRLVGASPFASALSTSSSQSFAAQALSNNFNDFQAPLAISYEVDVFGRVRHAYNQARAAAEATAAERLAVRLSLTSQVASNYFAVRAADSTVGALRRGVKLRNDAVEIQQERVNGGSASDIDLLRARVEKSNADADLAEALQERQALENSLAALCGEAAGEFHLAVQPLDAAPPPTVPASVPAQAITRRPDLMEAEKRILAAGEGVQEARAHFLPVFKTGADYGLESSQTNQLFENQSRIWTISGSISIPIFDGGRNTSDLKAAQARNEQALAAYRTATLTALREVDTALSNLRLQAVQADARNQAAADARRVFEASQKSYQQGAMSYFEVIDAERILLSAELAQARTLGSRYGATVDLVKALGGGF
jgi:multidrug efflux system outer membrane protein